MPAHFSGSGYPMVKPGLIIYVAAWSVDTYKRSFVPPIVASMIVNPSMRTDCEMRIAVNKLLRCSSKSELFIGEF